MNVSPQVHTSNMIMMHPGRLPRVRLLLLAADQPSSALDIPGEFDAIRAILKQTSADDRVRFIASPHHRPTRDALPGLLCEEAPHILHISGHMNDQGQLDFAGQLVDSEALAATITCSVPGLRCVVLNVCKGDPLALRLRDHVDVVVSMRDLIDNQAAHSFARAFYLALREGVSVEGSLEVARGQLELEAIESADCPGLYSKSDSNPAELFAVDFAQNPQRIQWRRTQLVGLYTQFARQQAAKDLLRRRGQQRSLPDLLIPIELVEVDPRGQLGIEPRSITEVWDQCKDPLLLTGEVGSGKSTLLAVLANELATRTSASGTEPVPVLRQAKPLAQLRKQLDRPLEFADLFPHARAEPEPLHLLVDSFDEVTPNLLWSGEQCLYELADSEFVARLVVTSRPRYSWRGIQLRRYQLRPWTEAHITEFVSRWNPEGKLGLGELRSGNPLTLTLACAYAGQAVSGGLLTLLGLVLRDLREDWRERTDSVIGPDPDINDLQDCCLWLLLGPRETDPSTFPRKRFDPILRFLEREGLVLDGEEPIVSAGARWVVEYLASQACVRWGFDLERLAGRLDLRELAKVALALELSSAPERGRTRLRRAFDLELGRGAFRLRLATLAARACSLHGQQLDLELTTLAINCLWRYVIDDCSQWKSPEAAEALEALCQANHDAARLVRMRIESVIDCSPHDATQQLAARDGLLHVTPRVRAATLAAWDPASPCLVNVLWTHLHDEGSLGTTNVPIAAGRKFRTLPRTPELEPVIQQIATYLRHGTQFASASAAAALFPHEAPLDDLSEGMRSLSELKGCSPDISEAFLEAGGLEAPQRLQVLTSSSGGVARSLADTDEPIIPRTPVPYHSLSVQRSCWRWLVPALGHENLDGLTEVAARKASTWHQREAFTAVVRIARHRPDVLVDVFARARVWSLVVEQAASRPLQALVRDDPRVFEALLDYLRRGQETKIGGYMGIIEMLEPVLDRPRARSVYLDLLPRAWTNSYIPFALYSPPPYVLPSTLFEAEDILEVARRYATWHINQIDERDPPAGIAIPLMCTAWTAWESPATVCEGLERWLALGGNRIRIVGTLLQSTPDALIDALRPTIDAYLARPIRRGNHEEALARQLMFQALPRGSLTDEALASFEEYALAHAELRTTGSFAAIAELCKLVEPQRARELAAMAAAQRLHAYGLPTGDMEAYMHVLAPLAPDAYLALALQNLGDLRTAAPIFEALFASWDPATRSELAHLVWSGLQGRTSPYRSVRPMDLVGQRPADLGQKWLYHYANVYTELSVDDAAPCSD